MSLNFLFYAMVGRRCCTLESSLVPSSFPGFSDAASSEPCQGQGAMQVAFNPGGVLLTSVESLMRSLP